MVKSVIEYKPSNYEQESILPLVAAGEIKKLYELFDYTFSHAPLLREKALRCLLTESGTSIEDYIHNLLEKINAIEYQGFLSQLARRYVNTLLRDEMNIKNILTNQTTPSVEKASLEHIPVYFASKEPYIKAFIFFLRNTWKYFFRDTVRNEILHGNPDEETRENFREFCRYLLKLNVINRQPRFICWCLDLLQKKDSIEYEQARSNFKERDLYHYLNSTLILQGFIGHAPHAIETDEDRGEEDREDDSPEPEPRVSIDHLRTKLDSYRQRKPEAFHTTASPPLQTNARPSLAPTLATPIPIRPKARMDDLVKNLDTVVKQPPALVWFTPSRLPAEEAASAPSLPAVSRPSPVLQHPPVPQHQRLALTPGPATPLGNEWQQRGLPPAAKRPCYSGPSQQDAITRPAAIAVAATAHGTNSPHALMAARQNVVALPPGGVSSARRMPIHPPQPAHLVSVSPQGLAAARAVSAFPYSASAQDTSLIWETAEAIASHVNFYQQHMKEILGNISEYRSKQTFYKEKILRLRRADQNTTSSINLAQLLQEEKALLLTQKSYGFHLLLVIERLDWTIERHLLSKLTQQECVTCERIEALEAQLATQRATATPSSHSAVSRPSPTLPSPPAQQSQMSDYTVITSWLEAVDTAMKPIEMKIDQASQNITLFLKYDEEYRKTLAINQFHPGAVGIDKAILLFTAKSILEIQQNYIAALQRLLPTFKIKVPIEKSKVLSPEKIQQHLQQLEAAKKQVQSKVTEIEQEIKGNSSPHQHPASSQPHQAGVAGGSHYLPGIFHQPPAAAAAMAPEVPPTPRGLL